MVCPAKTSLYEKNIFLSKTRMVIGFQRYFIKNLDGPAVYAGIAGCHMLDIVQKLSVPQA